MKCYIQIVFFLLSIHFGFSQNKGIECGYYGNKTIEERNKIFPFNKTKKIVLVAFPAPNMIVVNEDSSEEKIDSLSLSKMGFKITETINLPSKNNIKEYNITEKIELNSIQINELSNLVINYKIKKNYKGITIRGGGCFFPRNAILFLDEKDKIVSYIEICFECIQFYQMPEVTIPNFNILCQMDECSDMIGLFKTFFKSSGIKYGVEK